ncbi:MAG: hypothetical protein WBQ08_18180 [Candidatus Sulfotelmatobacter sp.]
MKISISNLASDLLSNLRRAALRALPGALIFMVCACALSFAGETDSHGSDSSSAFHGREFNGVVHAIEDHYGVRHTHIPFLSFAMSLASRPAGVSGIRLAVFEDFHPSSASMDASASLNSSANDDLQHVVEHSLGPDWHLFVRTRTQDDSDDALIYVNLGEARLQMMIVTIEPDEATVVEMNLSDRALKKWLDEPKESAEDNSDHHHHLAED